MCCSWIGNAFYFCFLCILLATVHGAHEAGDGGGDSILNIGLLLPYSTSWPVGPKMGAAIIVGIHKVHDEGLIPGFSLEYTWKDTHCSAYQGLTGAMNLWSGSSDLDVFIGGGCSVVCEPVALVSAVWNIPQVSWGCNSADLSDKHKYPTFTRTVGPWVSLAPVFGDVMSTFGWSRAGILATSENIMQLTANAFRDELHRRHMDVFRHDVRSVIVDDLVDTTRLPELKEAVKLMKQETRIIILVMGQRDINRFLIFAHEEGMINGDYVFMGIDADLSDDTVEGTSHQEALSKGYQGFVSCNLRKPSGPEWQTFAQAVVDEFPTFDSSVTPPTIDQVDVHAGMLHDAVLMWATGVNKTINDLGVSQLDNGTAITANLLGTTFEGISGTVVIDENGDRKPDYSIQITQNGSSVTLLDYISFYNNLTKIYQPNQPGNWDGIFWAGYRTSVPKGEPDCGWNNEHCSKTKLYVCIGLVCLAFLIVAVTIVVVLARRVSYEREIHDQDLWRISWNEVQQNQIASQIASQRAALTKQKTMRSLGRGEDTLSRTIIAKYKGTNVAVKQLGRSSLDTDHLSRSFLVEIKNIRDLNHENVNKFVGAVTEAPHVSLLMAYCSKGSLQDVLLNESFNLTVEFKTSLANDISKGMHYLHKSPLRSHGSLTSNNVVVDSRWVAKITDYGFSVFKEGIPRKPHSGLWTAPELLRKREEFRPVYGSQAGDVYSFGIILSEIVTRDIPFAKNNETHDTEAIINYVQSGRWPNCRPVIPPDMCSCHWTKLMHDCWTEVVAERPSFKTVKARIKEINGGRDVNAIDNMLSMLEQHSEQLEEVLEEKSSELECVRQKCEALLLTRVPRDVMRQIEEEDVTDPETLTVSVLQTGIHNFSKITQIFTPTEVCYLLSTLWWKMDNLCHSQSVFKTDTAFTDGEVVVSRDDAASDEESANILPNVALKMLHSVGDLELPKLKGKLIPWKAAIHTGECLAMVVGQRTPRYSVFGKAVSTTGKLYKHNSGLRILISNTTKDSLTSCTSFRFEHHRHHEEKEMGIKESYWLTSENELPDPDRAATFS